MINGKASPYFNQVPTPYNTVQQQYNTTQQPYNTTQPITIPRSITRHLSITHHERIELAIEMEEEKEEALEEVMDQWYATIVNNQDTMQENSHFHVRTLCIFMHQFMA